MRNNCIFIFVLSLGVFLTTKTQEIRHPPDVKLPSSPKITYVASRSQVNLTCRADGVPSPRYIWQRNRMDINSGYIHINNVTGELWIDGFTEREEGEYRCLASNTWGTAVAPKINLVNIRSGSFYNNGSLEKSVSEGESLSLTCRYPPVVVPKVVLSWYTTALGSDGNAKSLQPTSRIGVDEKGTLHFAYVIHNDALPDSEYSCSSPNFLIDSITLGSKVRLTVKETTGVEDSKPRTLYTSGVKTERLHRNATLECFFGGKPVPEIQWLDRNNNNVSGNPRLKVENFGRRLVISNVTENDEGEYTCKGINNRGHQTEKLYLNVTSRPIWVRTPQSKTAIEGSDVTFTCEARAARGENSPSDPMWFVNGVQIFKNDTRMTTPTTFHVKNVSRDRDLMNLQCLIENEIGEIFQDVFLNILLPIRITQRPPAVIKVEKGDQIALSVSAITDPSERLGYQWKKNGLPVQVSSPGHTLSGDYRTLTINTTTFTQDQMNAIMGHYTCIVSNTYEKKLVEVQITKPEIDPDIMITSRPETVVKIGHGDTMNLTVVAHTDMSLTLKYSWKKEEEVLDIPSHPELSVSDDFTTLTINTSKLTYDEMPSVLGRYRCEVSNTIKMVEVEVIVEMVDAPVTEGVVVADSSSNLWILAVVLGVLFLIGGVFIIVFVLRHRYPKRVYQLEKKELKSKLDPVRDLEDEYFKTL